MHMPYHSRGSSRCALDGHEGSCDPTEAEALAAVSAYERAYQRQPNALVAKNEHVRKSRRSWFVLRAHISEAHNGFLAVTVSGPIGAYA